MTHYFDKTEDEIQCQHDFETAVAIVIPNDYQGTIDDVHLLESKEVQATWDHVERGRDFIEDVFGSMAASPDDLTSYRIFSYCYIDGQKHRAPPVIMLMTERMTLNHRQQWSKVNCGQCRGAYLFELRNRGEEDRAKALETLWLEIYGEIADCDTVHHLEPAGNYLLICTRCGRYHQEIDPKHTAYFAGSRHEPYKPE